MTEGVRFVRAYPERVVNDRDWQAVDELVLPEYVGKGDGWPEDRDALRSFYRWQAETRPGWRIDVQETVELGDCVVVRALAGGTATEEGVARREDVEWLAAYRLAGGRIAQIELLALQDRS